MHKNKITVITGAILSLALLTSLAYVGCGGGAKNSSGSSADTRAKVTIKGTLTGGSHARLKQLNRFDRFLSDMFTPRLWALTAADVAKVIGFNHNGNYFVTIVDELDNFSIQVDKGYPTALIFLDATDHYLGYLTLSNGIDSLPLAKLADTVTMTELATIDLQALSSSGVIVTPLHNPIGSELPLSAEERTAIAQGDDFFASIIKNTDVDNNGAIDLLQGKFYRPFITYFVNAGNFGGGLTPSVITPANITGFRFNASISEQGVTSFPSTVTFQGPSGSGLTGQTNDASPLTQPSNALYGSPYISSPAIPPVGAYTVTYYTTPLVFNIPAQTAAISNIVLAVPTITLTSSAIQSLSWVYKLGSGDAVAIDPRTIIESIQIQINGSGTQYDPSYPQGASRLYSSANFAPGTATHTMPTTSVSGANWSIIWANVTTISMAYNDIFGNHYVVDWHKP